MSTAPMHVTPRAASLLPDWLPGARLFGVGLPLAVITSLILLVHHADPNKVGSLGLITVVPVTMVILLLILVGSFALHLRRAPLDNVVLAAHVIALVVMLHGADGLLEQEPRFATAWLHVGFVDAIIHNHYPLTTYDARFSWPGFFTSAAMVVGMVGANSALPLLRWAPMVFDLVYLLPVVLIARTLVPSAHGRWMLIWLFVITNWVGQDYFSPQALAYLLFLACLAVLMAVFSHVLRPHSAALQALTAGRVRGIRQWFSQWLEPADQSGPPLSGRQSAGVATILLISFCALVMTHPFTPIALVADVASLIILRRFGIRSAPLLMVLLIAVWLSYAAVDFWSGHLSDIFGSGGSKAVSANVAGRLHGSSEHLVVVAERVAMSLAVWTLAALGVGRLLKLRRPVSRAALALALAPFPMLVLQSYGGEAQLRLFLYTLPFMLALGVCAFVPRTHMTGRAWVAFTLISLIAIPGYFIARYGNEQFEQIRSGEVAALQTLYRIGAPGATIATITPNAVLRYRDITKYSVRPANLNEFALGTVRSILNVMGKNRRGDYLMVTRSQIEYAEQSYGLSKHWGVRVQRLLNTSKLFNRVYWNPDAALYRRILNPSTRSTRVRVGGSTRLRRHRRRRLRST